jgi:hypothetical protein
MFSDWENFYLIVGGAAGALIGVMFVVTTLSASLEENRASRGTRIYITPIVFHFAIVLIISAMAVTPDLPTPAIAAVVAICALSGFAYSFVTTMRIFAIRDLDLPDWDDKVFYGILPTIVYLALACAAAAVWFAPTMAALSIALVMLAILLVGIRNAWDLATFLVIRKP